MRLLCERYRDDGQGAARPEIPRPRIRTSNAPCPICCAAAIRTRVCSKQSSGMPRTWQSENSPARERPSRQLARRRALCPRPRGIFTQRSSERFRCAHCCLQSFGPGRIAARTGIRTRRRSRRIPGRNLSSFAACQPNRFLAGHRGRRDGHGLQRQGKFRTGHRHCPNAVGRGRASAFPSAASNFYIAIPPSHPMRATRPAVNRIQRISTGTTWRKPERPRVKRFSHSVRNASGCRPARATAANGCNHGEERSHQKHWLWRP